MADLSMSVKSQVRGQLWSQLLQKSEKSVVFEANSWLLKALVVGLFQGFRAEGPAIYIAPPNGPIWLGIQA